MPTAMFKHAVVFLASAWLVGAQNSDDNSYHPHAAFAFIRTGERTPLERQGNPVLTGLGANQMYTLGQNFRSRYISGKTPGAMGVEHISGMSLDTLDNDQVLVQTLDTPYLVSSAQAFMQGLYPPHTSSSDTSGAADVDNPLNGYQYANIQTVGALDPGSMLIAGANNCPIAQRDAMRYFTTDSFLNTKTAEKTFYEGLDVNWFEGNLNQDQLDYTYALEIADYLTYQYSHNSAIQRILDNNSTHAGVYNKVLSLADQEAWSLYGNTSTSSSDADNQAIGGKTLASAVLGAFEKLILDRMSGGNTSDMSYPLTLFFGEQGPMISLLSIMMADYHNTYFQSVPAFGSALIFELFSTGDHVNFPSSTDDLWVRFYFHNGTGYEKNQLMAYPILGNGPSGTDIPWQEFSMLMSRLMMNSIADWCSTCQSGSLFCWGVQTSNSTLTDPSTSNSQRGGNKVSPAVAGVIGALVTLVVAGLIFAAAMLLGGIRFHRTQKHSRQSSLGGFKGSAKLASDPDLSLAKHAALPAGAGIVTAGMGTDAKRGHERVGSWELRQKEFGAKAADYGERSPRESFDNIDAVAAARPVEPHERV